MVDGSAMYPCQSGVGTAEPVQVTCCSAFASPVVAIGPLSSVVEE
jgi:hypothetical protein